MLHYSNSSVETVFMPGKIKKAPGQIIEERMDELGYKNQTEFARKATVSQGWVSQMFRGVGTPLTLDVQTLVNFLQALDWTKEDFQQATGLTIPELPSSQPRTAAAHLEVPLTFRRYPVLSAASAGTGRRIQIEDEFAYVPLEDLSDVGANPDRVLVYRANGDCMQSESTKGIYSIVDGDNLVVDPGKPPRQGDIVVAWDAETEKLLVKRFKEEGDHIIFYPARAGVSPVVRPNDEHTKVIGPVVWRGGPVRRKG